MKLYNPAPGRKVTSDYGPRKHPITGQTNKMHHGIDYGGSFDVLCAGDGVVEHVGWSPKGGGHVVIIKHASNLYTVYYHGREATKLQKGERVKAGQFIYRSGNTGASNGNHLHFEVRTPTRAWGSTADPNIYLSGDAPAPEPAQPQKAKLKVDGRLDRSTWRAWQQALKDNPKYEYYGIIDGIPGPITWRAVQRSCGAKVDGMPGPNTRKSVQRLLKNLREYSGRIDGIWGRGTISALQRALNKGTYR